MPRWASTPPRWRCGIWTRCAPRLGYASINLYGGSYGTRVAQHYLRRYPEHTRTVILDGVVPPQMTLGASMALDAQSALQRIFARCVADAACRGRFGDPEQTFNSLLVSLKHRAVPVAVPDPFTGQTRKLNFDADDLGTVVRLSSYSSEQSALLPLVLDEAQAHANFVPLAGLMLQVTHSLDNLIAVGMHNSVVCCRGRSALSASDPRTGRSLRRPTWAPPSSMHCSPSVRCGRMVRWMRISISL